MAYPSAIDSFITKIDGRDRYIASHINAVQTAIVNVETELGTDPAGSLTDLKTRLAVMLNNDGTLKGYGQCLVVAKSGSAYSSLATAVAAITDASASKPYCILLMPGIYETSEVTLPDYVSLVGIDSKSCILKASTPTSDNTEYVINVGEQSNISNISVINDCNISSSISAGCVRINSKNVNIYNCIISNTASYTSGTADVYGISFDSSAVHTLDVWNTQIILDAPTSGVIGVIGLAVSGGTVTVYQCDIQIIAGIPTVTYCIDLGTGGETLYIYNSIVHSVVYALECIGVGIAENCEFKSTANNAHPLSIGISGCKFYNCTIKQHGSATVCIGVPIGTHNICVAHCRMNLANPIHTNLTNLIGLPLNVSDTDV